jgi:hypothetical protein
LLVTHQAKATQPPSIGTTLFDEVILQHGHLMLGRLQTVNFMSYDQVEVALSMLFFHKFLNPKQKNPLNETVFQNALLDILNELWQQSKSSKPSPTSTSTELAFENCHLMRYLRMSLLKIDTSHFQYGLDKYQKVLVGKAIERIMPELCNTESGNLFINSLIELLPAMTVGYGLLVGNVFCWKNPGDAKMARVFMFAFLNLDFVGLEDYMSAEHALEFLCHTQLLSSDMVKVWLKLFDVNQYKGLGEIALSEEEARLGDQDRERIVHRKRRQQLHKRLTGMDVSYGSHLTRVPFRSLSLICKQPLMLKKAAMIQGPVYRNMSCLLQAGDTYSRNDAFHENVLADLKEIAKLESLMPGEYFTVSSLYICHTKEFLTNRSFILSQDFHALPLKLQAILLTETRPDGVQPVQDTPTSIVASVQDFLDFFRNAYKREFTSTELESANESDWFALDVVHPGHRDNIVPLQYCEHPESLSNQCGTQTILSKRQCYQTLWGANMGSPNNRQYVSIAHIDNSTTGLCAELLMIPTVDASDSNQKKATLKIKGSIWIGLGMAAVWWDPKSKLVRLQKMSFDKTVCQMNIPRHLILDDCPQVYGLEHRMIVVLSRTYVLPTLEEAAQMLTMKERQLHDLKDQEYFGDWTIIAVKPKCLANLEYAPGFPLSRPSRLLAIASEFSDLQKLNPMRGPGDVFTPSEFLVRIGMNLLESVLMTSQNDSEMSKAAWLVALEDLDAYQVVLMNEAVEQDSTTTIRSYLLENHWTYNQLITGDYDVVRLPVVVRFLWHQHRLMVAGMLGRTQDALNWDTSLASDLIALSMSDLLKGINDDTMYGLICFFQQGFWTTASPQKKQEWLQMMQYIHPYIKSCWNTHNVFMPENDLPLHGLPAVMERIIPTVSDAVPAHQQLLVYIKTIVASAQAKTNRFVDFVPVMVLSNQFKISSNQSGLCYAILDRDSPSKWSIYAPDDMMHHEINNSQVLIAHHCRVTLTKLLLNYVSYKQRGILTFALLDEHFLVYMLQVSDHSS